MLDRWIPSATALVVVALVAGCGAIGGATDADRAFAELGRDYLDAYYETNPVRATSLGIHRWDDRLPDVSRAGIDAQVERLRGFLAQLHAIDRGSLTGDAYLDHRILEYAIRAELLELEEVRSWRKNPSVYNTLLAGGLANLASRTFAPIEDRIHAMIARIEQFPAVIDAAKANLDDVPKLWAEHAVRNTRGTVAYLERDLPAMLEAQGLEMVDPLLRERWDETRTRAVADVAAFSDWIETDLLPRANGEFRLGRELFERKVRYEEHVDLSADQLREMNERAIGEYQAWVAREAARIDPNRTPAQIMDSITRIFPQPEELIATARRQLDEIRAFIVERDIVTLPSDGMPTVRETPPYERGGFASMSTPGPFETVATEAYYNITNVDPAWTDEQKTQHMTYFNYPGLLGITVHEAMPGHFVQLLYRPQIPTEIRKVFGPGTLVEGWAHYTEQMMVDEGLGRGDPGVRLGQLRRALQRHARWYAGLEMHAFGESIERATDRYMEIAYFARFPARSEVERGTSNPTYLYYALGRMQILELREDYRRLLEARRESFSLRDFHDRFLQLGLPVSLAREAMLE